MSSSRVTSSRVAWAVLVASASLVLVGCDDGNQADAPLHSSASPSGTSQLPAPDEEVTRLPGHLDGTVTRLGGIPTEFPLSLDTLSDATLGPETTGVKLSYRPRETLSDGSGWASETVVLWLPARRWAKLSLDSLGMPEDLWPGGDMIGAGALNDDGSRLAFRASSGVVVIDLASGRWRHYLDDIGQVGEIRWHPGGKRFTADPWRRGPDLVVDVASGSASQAIVPARGLGFLTTGEAVSVRRTSGRDTVATADGAGAASVSASSLMSGHRFMSWFTGGKVAYSNRETARGRYALRVARYPTGDPMATLTWNRRTGTFLSMHGWWDSSRILMSIDRSLLTWSPETGQIVRVAALPQSDVRLEHASIGLSFPQPLR